MLASRTALRATTRNGRVQSLLRPARRRLESTSRYSTPKYLDETTRAGIIGGLVGGAIVSLLGYSYYRYSGTATVINTVKSAKSKFESTIKESTEKAPAPNEAIQWLRQTAKSYASYIPGAQAYVDSAFDDIGAIQKKHGEEVNNIVNEAYDELNDATTKGVSLDTAAKAWDIIQTAVKRIGELADDAAEDILNNHPELQNKLGISIDQLTSTGDQYGPEAKKKVEETWQQVQEIIKGGIGLGTADQLRRLIQDKIQEVQKMGEQVWQKGIEQVKPYLDKSPQVKELVEQNKDKLMQGNLTELWEKVRMAAMSGDTRDLEKFVTQTVEEGKSKVGGSGAGLQQHLNLIPGASEIMPKFEQLQEIAEKEGDEVQKLVKETFKEIQEVLARKVEEAQKLAEKVTKR